MVRDGEVCLGEIGKVVRLIEFVFKDVVLLECVILWGIVNYECEYVGWGRKVC